ncbi:MAG: YigZ family protein [Eubacterium sp.]|nr:YigZ family protein [Eubacterium sp.]
MESSMIILYQGGQGEYTEKKSRFIASIFPVQSEEEALENIARIRKEHYDARHNCFAYVIGDNNETERCSDDGEPSGTAGRPILDVLTGNGIHNAAAVVTRYFGGTLLGTGGLVRSYTAAVKDALEHCVLLEQCRGFRLRVRMDYNDVGRLQHLFRTMELTELDTIYGAEVEEVLLVPSDRIDRVEDEITEKTAGRAVLHRQEELRFGMAGGEVILLQN